MKSNHQKPLTSELVADREICLLDRKFKIIQDLTPLNLDQEYKAFFSGKRKNPVFKYRKQDEDELESSLKRIQKIPFPDTEIGQLLKEKAAACIDTIKLLQSIGSSEFSDYSQKIYSKPSQSVLASARRVLKNKEIKKLPSKKTLSSEAVANSIKDVLEQYKIKNWSVVISDKLISGVVVSSAKQTIYVFKDTNFDISRLGPLITHEIETHVLTGENGRRQPLQIFKQGFAGYIKTQEGLASYNVAKQHPEQSNRPARFWARNALAVDLALDHSFVEVFEAIRKMGFSKYSSFAAAVKVKRGLKNTQKPGAFTKDHVYLEGLNDIENFVKNGGDIRDLYYGKIDLKSLDIIKKQNWLIKPYILPKFLLSNQTEEKTKR